MASNSSITAQGIVIRQGTIENFLTATYDNVQYPTIEGFFDPDGFPGGFDTLLETNILRASGSDTATYAPSSVLGEIFEFLIDNQQTFYDENSNFPVIDVATEDLSALPSGYHFNTFITTNIIRASGSDTDTYAPSSVLGELFEFIVDNQQNFYDNNTNYLESFSAAPSGFLYPNEISGNQAWWTADSGLIVTEADILNKWVPLEGDDSFFGVVDTNPVLLQRSLYNSKNAFRFNGISSYALMNDNNYLDGQEFTIFAVVKDTNTDSGNRQIVSNYSVGASGGAFTLGVSGTDRYVTFCDELVSTSTISAGPLVLVGRSSASDAEIFANGVSIGTKGSALSERDLNTLYGWIIGKDGENNAEYWDGDILQLAFYNRSLTNSEISSLVEYSNLYYNLGL